MPNPQYLTHMHYPLEPSQISRAVTVNPGEETGMVFCPRKMAGIAHMRCAEYQQRDGCAAGCRSAVPPARVLEIRSLLKTTDERYLDKKELCERCGEWKYRHRPCVSEECAPESQNYRHARNRLTGPASRRALNDLPQCKQCGASKLSKVGELCRKCAGPQSVRTRHRNLRKTRDSRL